SSVAGRSPSWRRSRTCRPGRRSGKTRSGRDGAARTSPRRARFDSRAGEPCRSRSALVARRARATPSTRIVNRTSLARPLCPRSPARPSTRPQVYQAPLHAKSSPRTTDAGDSTSPQSPLTSLRRRLSLRRQGRNAMNVVRQPHPVRASGGEPPVRRYEEQRWLIDNIIRANGIDWDQPRSLYLSAPCGVEANADFAGIRERVKKMADIGPAFEAVARRREA